MKTPGIISIMFMLGLGGCSKLAKTSAFSTSSTPSSPSTSSASHTGDTAAPDEPTPTKYSVGREELSSLVGKTPDQAKKLLKDYSHDGQVKVEPADTFYEGCGENRVCGLSVPGSGMSIHDDITLYINPGLSISAPPEE